MTALARSFSLLPSCANGCGRSVNPKVNRPMGWYETTSGDTAYICDDCAPSWTPVDAFGRGPEAGACGVIGSSIPDFIDPSLFANNNDQPVIVGLNGLSLREPKPRVKRSRRVRA